MTGSLDLTDSTLDRIRHDLVGLRMPRALEALDQIVRRLEQSEISALEAIDILLSEELTLRENSRIKTALRMGRLGTIKTLAGFDFSFQPSLDRDRILTLAQLGFVARGEVVHFLGPPGTGKSHLATALGVEAVKAGRGVYFCTLADLLASLARSEREGRLQERIRFFCRPSLLIVDEIGYLPVVPGGGNLFFQLVNARYERGAMLEQRAKLSRGNDLVKAMNYMLKRWAAFTLFLEDGRVCLSNNAAERALRGICLGRKSWLFCGSDRGGQWAAAMYSLIITAKMNDVDPQAWLADVLARIATHPAHRLDELLPWNWKAMREQALAAQAA